MKLIFKIEYYTEFGEILHVCGNIPALGSWMEAKAPPMQYLGEGKWVLEIFPDSHMLENLEYSYFLYDERTDSIQKEWGSKRTFRFSGDKYFSYLFMDNWRPQSHKENPLFTSAFIGNLWRRTSVKSSKKTKSTNQVFQLYAPRIDNDHVFCIGGEDRNLGNWNRDEVILMDDSQYPLWTAQVFLENDSRRIYYKYGIYNVRKKKFIAFEDGTNRVLENSLTVLDNGITVKTDIHFRHPHGLWKGAGVAIPVFSLRTEKSFGVGEFMDLKVLIDWAVKTKLKLVQILPVNDTIANHNWKDSYPYAAISVFALHPVYLNLPKMGRLKDEKIMDSFIKKGRELNKGRHLDYVSVMELKSKYFKLLYDQNNRQFLQDSKYKKFFKENKDWLVPYAAFSRLRDQFGTPDFTKWGPHSSYNYQTIQYLVHPSREDFDDYAVHYFIQYHLHLQLSEVAEYARKKGVVLKGDLPIGIYRDSVDAWVEPQLYNMDKQAGAPPDAYSVTGQNWRFPTYNWEEMKKDDYAWWRRRLSQMAKYFDAYRIDHILGFFRIWEIAYKSIEGLMGIFNPAIPMYKDEMERRGLFFDFERFCRPVVRSYMIDELFGSYREEVVDQFLEPLENGDYSIKTAFDTQRKVEDYFNYVEMEDRTKADQIKFGLYTLIGNVLFFEVPDSNGWAFHPKIAFHNTYTYRELDDRTKNILNEIYTHYFYHRQENFWREQAMVKLPAINKASNMLICGEDLGMVPDCVPGVLHELGILRLYIQRMPKETDAEFGHPANAPYLSVASPSCHDMSTVRGWWEEDHERSKRFYHQVLGFHGDAPQICDIWISQAILEQHFHSTAMWAIFPIQDLVGMEEKLMQKDPAEERINDPSNPNNLWRYRFHMNIEDLLKEVEFNKRLREMVVRSGR